MILISIRDQGSVFILLDLCFQSQNHGQECKVKIRTEEIKQDLGYIPLKFLDKCSQ